MNRIVNARKLGRFWRRAAVRAWQRGMRAQFLILASEAAFYLEFAAELEARTVRPTGLGA
jgi:hypothetical protein